MRMVRIVLLVVCSLLSFALKAETCVTGTLQLDDEFSSGALGTCTVLAENSVLIELSPEDQPINPSPWYAFRIQNVSAEPRTLTVMMRSGDYQHRYRPKLSEDKTHWQVLERAVEQTSAGVKFIVDVPAIVRKRQRP